jgi:uncharacterized membrane protein YdjX (TVP38/TMEM64 family)
VRKQSWRTRPKWQWACAGIALLVLVIAARQFALLTWIETFRAWTAQLGIAGIFIYGAALAILATAMVPCLPLTILAGYTFGMFGGLVAVLFGISLGAAFGFLFARYVARGAVARRIEHNPRFCAIDAAIAKDGWKIVGLLRMCPAPFGLTNYLYGLTAIGFWHYMLATLVGMLPGNALFVYLGAFGKRTIDGPPHPLEYVLGVIALGALVAVTLYLRRIAQRTAGAEFESR